MPSLKTERGNFTGSLLVKTLCFQCRGCRFDSWLGNYEISRATQRGQKKEKLHKRLSHYNSNLGKWIWIWTKTGRKHAHTKKQRISVHLFLHQPQTISKIQKGEVSIRTPKLVCLCLLPTLTPPLPSHSRQQILYSGWLPYFHNGFIINRRK